ncbi:MAG: hypothetical protein ACREQL_03490, partial [Candidatus Binatia bacterium]
MTPTPRRRGELAALVVLFTVATLLWTWPLGRHPSRAYLFASATPSPLQRADVHLTTWMLSWTAHALRTDPLGLFDANIFHPLRWTYALSENLLAGALLVLPADLVRHDPVLNHNLLVLASFVLGGVGTALLVRELGGSFAAACVAGAFFVFNPHRFASLGHVQVLSSQWMPFALLALHRLLATGRWTAAVVFAACFLLQALSSVYYLYFFGAAVVGFLLLHRILGCPSAPGARRMAWASLAAAGALLGLWMLPYAHARDVYSLGRTWNQANFFVAPASAYLGAVLDPLGALRERYVTHTSGTLLGLGALVLTCMSVVRTDTRRVAALYAGIALVGVFLSLGPRMKLYSPIAPGVPGPWQLVAAVVPGFDALRVPARAATVALLGVAVLMGLGSDALLRAVRGRVARIGVVVALGATLLSEAWHTAPRVVAVAWPTGGPAVYQWLARQPGDFAVVDLPLGAPEV